MVQALDLNGTVTFDLNGLDGVGKCIVGLKIAHCNISSSRTPGDERLLRSVSVHKLFLRTTYGLTITRELSTYQT